ncbi:hypothetical protein Lal_00032183 [Lupinus albus]|nr:hypothetical protein Lal_00032183 [Lupinus albus]
MLKNGRDDDTIRINQNDNLSKSNEASTSNHNFTCFECGKPGHMKMDCPNIKRSSFKGKNELKNGRRAYIAWEDNDASSASEPESEEQAHLSLMTSHHSDDEEGKHTQDKSRYIIKYAALRKLHFQEDIGLSSSKGEDCEGDLAPDLGTVLMKTPISQKEERKKTDKEYRRYNFKI